MRTRGPFHVDVPSGDAAAEAIVRRGDLPELRRAVRHVLFNGPGDIGAAGRDRLRLLRRDTVAGPERRGGRPLRPVWWTLTENVEDHEVLSVLPRAVRAD